jgi:hypothetical protein
MKKKALCQGLLLKKSYGIKMIAREENRVIHICGRPLLSRLFSGPQEGGDKEQEGGAGMTHFPSCFLFRGGAKARQR